jgi:ribose 5-phosphate isomerase B
MREPRDLAAPTPPTITTPVASPAQATPSPEAVRDVVRRIVDATLAADATARAASTPAPAAAPGSAPGAPEQVAIAVGADHGGVALKNRIGEVLTQAGFAVHDCGTHGREPVDYPDIAHAVATLVADGTCRWGVIVDGAGIGSCMVANKVPGIRAALCHDLSSARNSREHNHANVLTLGASFIGEGLAIEIVRAWLGTSWGPGRHAARVEKITDVERRYMRSAGEGRTG